MEMLSQIFSFALRANANTKIIFAVVSQVYPIMTTSASENPGNFEKRPFSFVPYECV